MNTGFIGEVHESLRRLQRQQSQPWPHQLTMARLVARGLRLGRGALIQVVSAGEHRLSYWLPCLLIPGPVIVCVPRSLHAQVLSEEIPWLRQHLGFTKPVYQDPDWPNHREGVLLVDPYDWLQAKRRGEIPVGIPVLMDGAEGLPEWVDQAETIQVTPQDWLALHHALPHLGILEYYHALLSRLLRRPLLRFPVFRDEMEPVLTLLSHQERFCPRRWQQFSQQIRDPQTLVWAEKSLDSLGITLAGTPLQPATWLRGVWADHPLVLIGQGLDADPQASSFRRRLGLPELTCLRFHPRPDQDLAVWIPTPLPAPNTPQFHAALLRHVRQVVAAPWQRLVILLSDQPLLFQLGASLAAEWGSRVGVNRPSPILVSSWEYWLQAGLQLPTPEVVLVGTLPFPSMADPLVAARVETYKRQHQDWFREYLLPIALTRFHHSLSGLRHHGGALGILDSRVLTRSYGADFLGMLQPYVRVSHLPAEP